MSPISKPLLAVLLLSSVLSVLLLLQPDTAGVGKADDELLAERHERPPASAAENTAVPWQRERRPMPRAGLNQGYAPPPPTPAPVVQAAVVVAPPPKPVAPQPAFTYLGRMVRDGKTLLFLGYGDEVEVVAVGDTIGGSWRIERVDAAGVELNYLPLNEMRLLALSER